MSNTKHLIAVLLLVLLPAGAAVRAADVTPALEATLENLLPGVSPDAILESPIANLYEVTIGTQVVYVTGDGRYLVRGDVVDLQSRRNLTESRRRDARLTAIRDLDEEGMIVFSPKEVKHTVTVFTDVDCGYCAKLHEQMADYNRLGVEIRYMAFPRAGVSSESYDKTVSVWCADDPHDAIGLAKRREPVQARTCENPVADHYNTGRALGVNGTPTIFLESGRVIPGYLPPASLLERLTQEVAG